MPRFLRGNALAVVMFTVLLASLIGQIIAGLGDYNDNPTAGNEADTNEADLDLAQSPVLSRSQAGSMTVWLTGSVWLTRVRG